MNIFQIPKLSNAGADTIVGVIDCSSSMEANWPWLAEHWNKYVPDENCLTITFDSIASVVPDNVLSSNINIHGGGGTNITAGFELLERELLKIPDVKNVTILFISDGADNRLTTLEKRMSALKGNTKGLHINFICLGVGAEFPTFVALRLREKYHSGDETLPAIFLIEYVTEKAYTIKFEALKRYFGINLPRKVTPAVCLFPWREYTETPFETAWVLTDSDRLAIDGEEFNVAEYYLNMRGINEIFRSWAQMMHLESLREGEKIQLRAKKTLNLMETILAELKAHKGIDFLSEEEVKVVGKTFYDRLSFLKSRRDLTRIKWFFGDVRNIAEGKNVALESQFEAAKRIGMGTIVGHLQQKILALKNIKAEEFAKIKTEFKELLKKHPVQERAGQEAGASGLKNLRAVLRDKTLEKGLDLCQSQYDLFEAFEFAGHPVRVNREKIEGQGPFELDVKFFDPGQTIELSAIVANKGTVSVKLANGREDTANAVLPLLSEDDADLAPFIASRLFKLLMTYNCLQDADNIKDDVYLGLLANALFCALKAEVPRAQKQAIAERIFQTANILFKDLPNSHYLVPHNPADNLGALLFKGQGPNLPVKRVAFSEAALKLVTLVKSLRLNQTGFKAFARQLICTLIFDSLAGNKSKINSLYDIQMGSLTTQKFQKETIREAIRKNFGTFFTTGDLRRAVVKQIAQEMTKSDIGTAFNPSKLDRLALPRVSINDLIQFANLYTTWDPSAEELEEMALTAAAAHNEASIPKVAPETLLKMRKDIENAVKAKQPVSNVAVGAKTRKKKQLAQTADFAKWQPLYQELLQPLIREFGQYFKNIHREIYPLTEEELVRHCWSQKIPRKNITVNKRSLLPEGVCVAPQCSFFLKKMPERLAHHMSIWGGDLPRGFHNLVKDHRKLSVDQIYDLFVQKSQVKHDPLSVDPNPLDFGRRKTEIVPYIQKLQIVYLKILG